MLKAQLASATLSAALASVRRGNAWAAINLLQAFQHQVRAQVGPADRALAQTLLNEARDIIDALECGAVEHGREHERFRSRIHRGEGRVHMEFQAQPGHTYIVEASSDCDNSQSGHYRAAGELVLPAPFGDKRSMSSFARVAIHASQFPENVRRDLLESLRRRQVSHKFHYDSVKQTQQWLALHQALSLSRTDPDCASIYDRSFEAAVRRMKTRRVHLIGLGCGGGQKDTRLLKLLSAGGREVWYTPCDVSTAMVLTAHQTALAVVPEQHCHPLVCDLATADDLPAVFSPRSSTPDPLAGRSDAEPARLFTFFGMMPNFEPRTILPKLAALVRRQDLLLFSANLAPGSDYARGMKKILPQYDNRLTRDWLMTFLLDLGIARDDGELRFAIENDPGDSGLKRVAADFRFLRARDIQVDAESFKFRPAESIRLFYSYRHTPALVRSVFHRHGLGVLDKWIAGSGEEAVFLCGHRRARKDRAPAP